MYDAGRDAKPRPPGFFGDTAPGACYNAATMLPHPLSQCLVVGAGGFLGAVARLTELSVCVILKSAKEMQLTALT